MIHSSTLLNFYLDFQNVSENVPHKTKKAVGQKGKILAQIQYWLRKGKEKFLDWKETTHKIKGLF